MNRLAALTVATGDGANIPCMRTFRLTDTSIDNVCKMKNDMIPVPQALRCVLAQTILALKQRRAPSNRDDVVAGQDCTVAADDDGNIVGRIAAQDVTMPAPGYPPFPISVMDGYAMCLHSIVQEKMDSIDYDGSQNFTIMLSIHSSIYAGDEKQDDDSNTFISSLKSGAIYVTTGAILPMFVDTVIPVEEVTVDRNSENNQPMISIVSTIWKKYYSPNKTSAWIRKIGFDIPENTVLLKKGQRIEVAHIGLILQAGYSLSSIQILRKPIVGVLSTGNELNTSSSPISRHLIPDVNRPILLSMLQSFHSCDTRDLGILKDDDIHEMKRVFNNAMDTCDVVISTGGISMGEKDLVQQALLDLGCRIHFGRLHMKPGKPTTFLSCPRFNQQGQILKTCLLFALPGNPVSSFVCTHLLVRPCLDLLHHGIDYKSSEASLIQNSFVHDEVYATIHQQQQPWKLDVERPEYHRVKMQSSLEGSYLATTTGVQQSSRVLSLLGADGLMVLPHLHGKLSALPGETYPVLLLNDGSLSKVQVKDSRHLQSAKPTIGIIQFINNMASTKSDNSHIQEQVYQSLGGQNHVCMLDNFYASSVDQIQHILQNELSEYLDILVIVCMQIPFLLNLKLSSMLTSLLPKISDPMALVMRNAISSVNPVGVLHDPVFGYYEHESKSFIIVSVPDNGLEAALESVAVTLKRALFISRG